MDTLNNAAEVPGPAGGPWHGVYPALVVDLKDPDNQGRVKVTLPLAPDPAHNRYEAWARPATLMAGRNRGTWFVPDTGDEVLVAFQGGDPSVPFVIGALWNGKDGPPQSMDGSGNNAAKIIRTRSGVAIEISDSTGQESITLRTPGGNKIVLQDGPGKLTIQDSNGNVVRFDSQGVSITATNKLRVDANEVTITAARVKVNAARVDASNEITAKKITVDDVVASSYTPGAGNVL